MIAVFGIGPLLDMLFGRDPANPDEETQTPQLLGQGYYVLLTLATVPVLIGTLVWAAGVFIAFGEWGWLGRLGWILSMGTVMGAVGIVVAHELIHKDSALEQAAGGILLAAVCYAGFKGRACARPPCACVYAGGRFVGAFRPVGLPVPAACLQVQLPQRLAP